MKKTINYLAVVSSLVISVSLAHADSKDCDENMHGQSHVPSHMTSSHATSEEMLFNKLDINGDGSISKAEFNAFNAKHFKSLDTNKDGKITRDEMQAVQNHSEQSPGSGHGDGTTHLDQRFNAADVNQDGGLDREEAKNMPMLSMYFDEVDANKDGKVTRQEYLDAMPLLHGAKKMDMSGKSQSM